MRKGISNTVLHISQFWEIILDYFGFAGTRKDFYLLCTLDSPFSGTLSLSPAVIDSTVKNEANPGPREDDDELEGVVVGDQDSVLAKPPKGIALLSHSWTFWFDYPAAKFKQEDFVKF